TWHRRNLSRHVQIRRPNTEVKGIATPPGCMITCTRHGPISYKSVRRESVGLDSKYETAPRRIVSSFPKRPLGGRFSEKRLGAEAKSDIDVVVNGELQETDGAFDSPEYVLDVVSLGFPKGWIMLGHAISEDQIVV